MNAETRLTWLKVASDIVIVFGLLMVLASMPIAAPPMSFLVDMIFWPVDGAQSIASETGHFLLAVGGGVTIGWGVLLYLLTTRLYPSDPGLARLLITASAMAWFIPDSLGSIASGAALNVLFNLGFLGLFMIPLWLPGKRAEANSVTSS